MKNIIHIILVALAFSISLQVSAQGHERMSKLEEKLSLTAEQITQLEALKIEKKTALDALPKDANREDKELIRDSFKQSLAEILTEEQSAQLEDLKNMKGQRGKRAKGDRAHGQRRGNFNLDDQKSRRTLSAEEKAKLHHARSALDTKISAEDRALIDELRLKSKALKESFKGNRESATSDERQAIREEMNEIKESLKTLSSKYKKEIKEALVDIREKKTGEHAKRKSEKEHVKRGHHAGKKIGKFLLMDVSENEGGSDLRESIAKPELSLSPNPAMSNTQLNYTVHTDGPVVIDIRDEQGQVVTTLLSETKKVGSYKLDVDLSQFQNKSYYITIKDKFASQSKQLIIVK